MLQTKTIENGNSAHVHVAYNGKCKAEGGVAVINTEINDDIRCDCLHEPNLNVDMRVDGKHGFAGGKRWPYCEMDVMSPRCRELVQQNVWNVREVGVVTAVQFHMRIEILTSPAARTVQPKGYVCAHTHNGSNCSGDAFVGARRGHFNTRLRALCCLFVSLIIHFDVDSVLIKR